MPRRVLERAREGDDAALRALLRRTPMEGSIRLTFEREPSLALSATVEGERHHLFVAREADGSVSGCCSRAVRRVFFNGAEARVGYLGMLRSTRPLAASRGALRAGFAACAATRVADELPFDVTSIMADNAPARRLLERGLSGLPRYEQLGELRTFVMPAEGVGRAATPAGVSLERGEDAACGEIAAFLQRQYRDFQLAPVWTEADLRSDGATRGLAPGDFVVARRGGEIVGCAALWDQSSYRQSVVRGYASWLGALRGVANLWSAVVGGTRLPAPGEPLQLATISHVAVENDDPAIATALIARVAEEARKRSIELLALGVAARRPLFDELHARLNARILGSVLYAVHYDGVTGEAPDGRPLHLEVATL